MPQLNTSINSFVKTKRDCSYFRKRISVEDRLLFVRRRQVFGGAGHHYLAMSSHSSFGSNMLFQTMNEDLNASMATADELSREFNSLLQDVAPSDPPVYKSASQSSSSSTTPVISSPTPSIYSPTPSIYSPTPSISSPTPSISSSTFRETSVGGGTNSTLMPYSTNSGSRDSLNSSTRNRPSSPMFPTHQLTPPQVRRDIYSTSPCPGFDSAYSCGQMTPPNLSPHTQRRTQPHNRSPSSSLSYMETGSSSSIAKIPSYDQSYRTTAHPSPTLLAPYDPAQMGRRTSQPDRSPSPIRFSQSASSTLPRNFVPFKSPDSLQRPKNPAKWNETDLDMSYENKTHNTYDKTEWMRPLVPNSNWRESNLDGPPLSSKKESLPFSPHGPYASLPRNTRISVPPDHNSSTQSPYHPPPIISRISIPPMAPKSRPRRPIPLSVIMRLQNPHWASASTRHPSAMECVADTGLYRQLHSQFHPQAQPLPQPLPREYLQQLQPRPQHPEQRQPAYNGEVLNPGDVDAELERLDPQQRPPVSAPPVSEGGVKAPAPRPLSPTRLQPVVDPQAQDQVIPDLEELLRIRAEIPRALKRRGSMDQSQPLKQPSVQPSTQYKQIMNKLFHRKRLHFKGEAGSETGSSSEGEESSSPSSPDPAPITSTPIPEEYRGYHSILRRSSRERKSSGRRARLSPLVLLLDGSLVGELETVQRAVQEMSDPSQPNDEGITALHNAICGGHYSVVDFLVRIGANVSAPDSHGWTPLHCAASCNDRPLCEFLVRNGAAVMAVTESDGASSSQKCDPYAVGFEECESFLRGVEEAMGLENSGVVYALWGYSSKAPDELSFKEGDMVTILQKPEGVDWWWASLCGREGFIPNNYFGLFPKVRPKSLC
ncbi:relA-associated inhibitor isoform X2 [Hypomesus transpacificus]|uniref:relA-associated inhibitor isoform X2 n=1 Tax=Hypomesus transpacificus TaxID=137520 RepID=UPI001F0713AE|nr:relA-associated inhibitor isoform X2 [Hypomesus transpacificus]